MFGIGFLKRRRRIVELFILYFDLQTSSANVTQSVCVCVSIVYTAYKLGRVARLDTGTV